MIQKTLLALLLCCIVVSCGKKGDPVFKDPKKKAAIKSIYFYKV